jgi:nicotinamide-nucleotide amidase
MTEEASALASRLARRLKKRNWTLATAESCTGGLLASTLTDLSGASKWFELGWITYSNKAKMEQLGISKGCFEGEDMVGAVSQMVALRMAQGAIREAAANVGIGITGIAGPGGGTADKEVGRVHVCVCIGEFFRVRRTDIGSNDRVQNKSAFVQFALRTALETIDEHDLAEEVRRQQAESPESIEEAEVKSEKDYSSEFSIKHLSESDEEWRGQFTWTSDGTVVDEIKRRVDFSEETEWSSD